jgi:DNA-binding NarL/FixJ family response regulator
MAGIEVVGEASDGDEALAVVKATEPDVVLMDVHMPGVGGVEATNALSTELPGVAVLVLTMMEDDASLFGALRAGARGYVMKGADQDELRRAIEAVANGEAVFGARVADQILSAARRAPEAVVFPELTRRELEILMLMARGQSNGRIARDLGLSNHTVANYASSIFTKLGVADRGEAIVKAREAGLARPGPG